MYAVTASSGLRYMSTAKPKSLSGVVVSVETNSSGRVV